MSIYKYQILKYLENHSHKNIKELRVLSKHELIKQYIKKIDKNELSKYLNKRKQRETYIFTSKQIIKIDWSNVYVWL
jgi:hypothetical protein